MNTKFIKQAFILLIFSLFFAGTALWLVLSKEQRSYGGEPVFAQTLQNLDNLGRITIKTPTALVNLQLEDNLWRVMETGNYYAGYRQINALFNDFSNARIYRRHGHISANDEKNFGFEDNAFSIITRDADGQILNFVQIGKATNNNLYHFARLNDEEDVFLITGNFSFPQTPISWLQQPLLSVASADIKSLEIGGEVAARSNPSLPFKINDKTNFSNLKAYLQAFGFLAAYDARRGADFDVSQLLAPKQLIITTFEGLVITLEIFTLSSQDYWVAFRFSTTALPTINAVEYLKNNAFLYEDWYFKLSPNIGKLLSQASLQQ